MAWPKDGTSALLYSIPHTVAPAISGYTQGGCPGYKVKAEAHRVQVRLVKAPSAAAPR